MSMQCVDERVARMGLACVVEPGDPRLGPMLAEFGAVAVWESLTGPSAPGAWARRAAGVDTAHVRRVTDEHGLRFVIPGDAEWPEQLEVLDRCDVVQESRGAPVGLWIRGEGNVVDLVEAAVGIVGARACTAYGEHVAGDLGAGLASRGLTVVSGGAYGIDAAAHRGACAVQGPTIAVVAGGLDIPYPRAHGELFDHVARCGVVVSEVPPGEHPTRRRFLTRNRLIAALTCGTVLVEAAARSGARNTVSWASACGRVVMAVPGSVHSATSVTPHTLLREGEAVLVAGVDDVCDVVGPLGAQGPIRKAQMHLLDQLTFPQTAVREALPARGGRDPGEIAVRAGVTLPVCLSALEELAVLGHAEPRADGRWRLGHVRDRPVATRGEELSDDRGRIARANERGSGNSSGGRTEGSADEGSAVN